MKKIIAVTSCPTGIAHTLMAAEALKKVAASLGHQIKVETQGSAGKKGVFTEEDIADADVVILATDIRIEPARFAGKPIFETSTSEAIRNTRDVIGSALRIAAAGAGFGTPPPEKAPAPGQRPRRRHRRSAAARGRQAPRRHHRMSRRASRTRSWRRPRSRRPQRLSGHTIKVETQGSVGAKNQLTTRGHRRARTR